MQFSVGGGAGAFEGFHFSLQVRGACRYRSAASPMGDQAQGSSFGWMGVPSVGRGDESGGGGEDTDEGQ
jgi:hypothetical protein